mmetsp:Transcript_130143/g.362592  ORF Transcript_130143/g.362592 Transcript_130143/m.362592 type:complete len:217 (-) Transcript_130143:341-991(-)
MQRCDAEGAHQTLESLLADRAGAGGTGVQVKCCEELGLLVVCKLLRELGEVPKVQRRVIRHACCNCLHCVISDSEVAQMNEDVTKLTETDLRVAGGRKAPECLPHPGHLRDGKAFGGSSRPGKDVLDAGGTALNQRPTQWGSLRTRGSPLQAGCRLHLLHCKRRSQGKPARRGCGGRHRGSNGMAGRTWSRPSSLRRLLHGGGLLTTRTNGRCALQ